MASATTAPRRDRAPAPAVAPASRASSAEGGAARGSSPDGDVDEDPDVSQTGPSPVECRAGEVEGPRALPPGCIATIAFGRSGSVARPATPRARSKSRYRRSGCVEQAGAGADQRGVNEGDVALRLRPPHRGGDPVQHAPGRPDSVRARGQIRIGRPPGRSTAHLRLARGRHGPSPQPRPDAGPDDHRRSADVGERFARQSRGRHRAGMSTIGRMRSLLTAGAGSARRRSIWSVAWRR